MDSDSGLTPYELRVKRNIEENQRVLQSLGLLNPSVNRKPVQKTVRRASAAVKRRSSVQSSVASPASPFLPARRTRRSLSALKAQGYEEDDIFIGADEENTPPQKKPKVVREHVFGAIDGVSVGDWWMTRMECSAAGVHRPTVAGISGQSGEGCYSIALSGGYEDDVDYGEYFTYTGSGGRDLKGTKSNPKNLRTAPQTKDQVLEGMNAALALNVENHRPVRVIRGYKLPSPYAPEEGYRYDGLYSVERWWTAVGSAGFKVFKYALKRLPGQEPPPWETDAASQNGHAVENGVLERENGAEDNSVKKSATSKSTDTSSEHSPNMVENGEEDARNEAEAFRGFQVTPEKGNGLETNNSKSNSKLMIKDSESITNSSQNIPEHEDDNEFALKCHELLKSRMEPSNENNCNGETHQVHKSSKDLQNSSKDGDCDEDETFRGFQLKTDQNSSLDTSNLNSKVSPRRKTRRSPSNSNEQNKKPNSLTEYEDCDPHLDVAKIKNSQTDSSKIDSMQELQCLTDSSNNISENNEETLIKGLQLKADQNSLSPRRITRSSPSNLKEQNKTPHSLSEYKDCDPHFDKGTKENSQTNSSKIDSSQELKCLTDSPNSTSENNEETGFKGFQLQKKQNSSVDDSKSNSKVPPRRKTRCSPSDSKEQNKKPHSLSEYEDCDPHFDKGTKENSQTNSSKIDSSQELKCLTDSPNRTSENNEETGFKGFQLQKDQISSVDDSKSNSKMPPRRKTRSSPSNLKEQNKKPHSLSEYEDCDPHFDKGTKENSQTNSSKIDTSQELKCLTDSPISISENNEESGFKGFQLQKDQNSSVDDSKSISKMPPRRKTRSSPSNLKEQNKKPHSLSEYEDCDPHFDKGTKENSQTNSSKIDTSQELKCLTDSPNSISENNEETGFKGFQLQKDQNSSVDDSKSNSKMPPRRKTRCSPSDSKEQNKKSYCISGYEDCDPHFDKGTKKNSQTNSSEIDKSQEFIDSPNSISENNEDTVHKQSKRKRSCSIDCLVSAQNNFQDNDEANQQIKKRLKRNTRSSSCDPDFEVAGKDSDSTLSHTKEPDHNMINEQKNNEASGLNFQVEIKDGTMKRLKLNEKSKGKENPEFSSSDNRMSPGKHGVKDDSMATSPIYNCQVQLTPLNTKYFNFSRMNTDKAPTKTGEDFPLTSPNTIEKKVRFSPDVLFRYIDGNGHLVKNVPTSSSDSEDKGSSRKLEYPPQLCTTEQPTSKSSQEDSLSILQSSNTNLNGDNKKQASILKYFGHVNKIEDKQVTSRGILLRSNRRSIVNNCLSGIESETPKNGFVPIIKSPSQKATSKESPFKKKSTPRKSTEKASSPKKVKKKKRTPEKHDNLLEEKDSLNTNTSPVKSCCVKLIRLDPSHTSYTMKAEIVDSKELQEPFKGWDWDDDEGDFLGFDFDDDNLFYGFEDQPKNSC